MVTTPIQNADAPQLLDGAGILESSNGSVPQEAENLPGEKSFQDVVLEHMEEDVQDDSAPTSENSSDIVKEEPKEEVKELTLLETLQDRLNNGKFVCEMSFKTLKHIRSFLLSKAVYKGHQEAIYLAGAMFAIESTIAVQGSVSLKETEQIRGFQLPASTIQIINYFLSKIEGTGYNSVETYLAMVAPIGNTMKKIGEIQTQIDELQKEPVGEVDPNA